MLRFLGENRSGGPTILVAAPKLQWTPTLPPTLATSIVSLFFFFF